MWILKICSELHFFLIQNLFLLSKGVILNFSSIKEINEIQIQNYDMMSFEKYIYIQSHYTILFEMIIYILEIDRLFRIICSMISSFEGWKHVDGITCIYKLMFYFFKTCLSLIKSCLSQIKGSGLLKLHGSDWKAMKKSWWMSTKCTL